MKIHEKISALRRLKKISQQKMAEKLNLTVNGYADIEHGKATITTDRLDEIAHALEVDVYELFNFGAKNIIYLNVTNSPFSSNFIWQNVTYSTELQIEIDKLKLIIDNQTKEIEYLKEINQLLRKF
ncbi:MAG: hypothetical protein RL637_94 [Pseudomonadota bacterium]